MKLDSIRVDNLLYNPSDLKSLDKLKEEHGEFRLHVKGLDPDSILRYIILMYDRNSELREDYPNIHQRKAIAAKLAGFTFGKKNQFPQRVEEMLLGKIQEVNIMIVKYILLHPDPDVLALELYYEMLVRQSVLTLGKIADPKEYKDILVNTEKLRERISELSNSVFGGDDVVAIRRELYGLFESKRTAIRPEEIAERIEKGEVAIDEFPYGNYTPQAIKLAKSKEDVYKG